ncbi:MULTISPECIES: HNH endonuclease [unclassified Polaromonas]|uniref:HNH endonuclease n=1 Tax=unclassified Polaromonas TaxID=2638319 RepID=UPI000F073A2E|nr:MULTISPECIES: HNH endonuclease [unclassified Polaromonas]AYQ28625.1 HNH endonuclease [Polaromonas sp. SP1]QGJ20258.1 HNH endonuclease [Polaromonas sp. Pch-P]
MELKKCILTGEDITAANDSRGHVIPSSLGGRLKPKGLVTKEANTTLNDRLDAPMVRALTPFMALLGGSRDGGTTAPIEMTDADGVAYRVSAGKPMTLARPGYDETPLGEGTRVEIRARTMPEARHLLQRAKSAFPQVDVDAAMNHAKMGSRYLQDMLRHQVELGPNRLFPGTFGIANLYAAHLGQPTHPDFKSYVETVPPRTGATSDHISVPMPPDTFYWIPGQLPVVAPAGIHHQLVYVSDRANRRALVYVSLFNLPAIAVTLPFNGNQDVEAHYAVDILSGEPLTLAVDAPSIRAIPWKSSHEDTRVYIDLVPAAVGRILEVAVKKSQDLELERIITEELGDAPVIDAAAIGRISTRVAHMLAAQILTRHRQR